MRCSKTSIAVEPIWVGFCDDGQRRVEQLGRIQVVKGYQGDVCANLNAEALQVHQNRHRDDRVRGEDSRRRFRPAEQFIYRLVPRLPVLPLDQIRIEGNAVLFKGPAGTRRPARCTLRNPVPTTMPMRRCPNLIRCSVARKAGFVVGPHGINGNVAVHGRSVPRGP